MRRPSLTLLAVIIASTVFFFVVLVPSTTGTTLQTRFMQAASSTKYEYQPERQLSKMAEDGTSVDDLQQHVEGFAMHASPPQQQENVIHGKPIMGKMPNETIRAELGRAGWKVFHTILAQYPEKPTPEERQTLSSYIHLFSRVYPCRECAEHFQQMLVKYPPQTSSKERASQWGCHVHNIVNKRLGKPIFDCNEISDKYACGCGEEEEQAKKKDSKKTTSKPKSLGIKIDEKQDITGG